MKLLRRTFFSLAAVAALLLPATTANALVINTTFDASVTTATNSAQIQSAFNLAAQYLQSVVTNNITINITVYWGAVGPFASGIGLGASNTQFTGTRTYAQLTNLLRAARTTVNDTNAVASLPATDPVATTNVWWFARAQAKALGVLSGSASGLDGSVGFASDVTYTFDPTNRQVSGKYDFISVAIHEITEVMGRVYFDLSTTFIPYDLFRFSAPGTRTFSTNAPTVYFSVDNGVNNLRNFNPNEVSGDLTDWALVGPADCCDYAITSGRRGLLSYADMVALDIIGYSVNYTPPKISGVKTGSNFVLSFTNIPGTTFTLLATTNITDALTNWATLGTVTDAVPGTFQITDNAFTTNKLRFYRARLN